MSPLDRRAFAAKQGLCYICLSPDHRSTGCPNSQARCKICDLRHHFLLHPPSNVNQMQKEEDLVDFQIMDTQQLSCGFQHSKGSLETFKLDVALTYITVILRNPKTRKEVMVNLLADTGANTSCIDTDLAKELELDGPKEPYHVQVGGGRIHSYASFVSEAEIQGIQPKARAYNLRLQVYKQPCGRLGPVDWTTVKKQWSHLQGLDLPAAADRSIQGIIGTHDFFLLAPTEPAVVGGRHDPIAYMSRLGWLVGGQISPEVKHAAHVHVLFMNQDQGHQSDCCREIRDAMERIWHTETLQETQRLRHQEVQPHPTASEQRAEAIFRDTQKRLPDGRYEVGLLWKPHAYLPSNYQPALQAFYHMERQMDRHPEMRNQFVCTVSEWLNKKIAQYVPLSAQSIRYVIPTFMVVRLDKATTSYRLVVDGARQFHGTCINDKLFTGPKLIQNIHDILINFRTGGHAFTCDIGSMYLNVKVPEKDQPFLSIFYREHSAQPLRAVQLTSHPFGLSSSPYVAMKVVQQHAEKNAHVYPLAKRVVDKCVIVDDFIVSHDDPAILRQTLKELQALLKNIGMTLHKMASNEATILTDIPPEQIAKSKVLGEDEIVEDKRFPTIKALGIIWNAERDTLAILFAPKHTHELLTLRKLVSDGGRLYDPLGLALPVSMTSRLLQQLGWRNSSGWDDPLPPELQTHWKAWAERTQHIHQVHIPRATKVRHKGVTKHRLIMFVDASAEAQAAVAYVQTLYSTGELAARLLTAKGKVSSLKKQESIPRLECLAAAMGAELAQKICHATGWSIEDTVFFSDSTTTLWWIRTTKPLKVFVANRVCTILDATEIQQWKYVNTTQNPADLPTRTCSVKQWAKHPLWWWGPTFLTLPDHQWPEQPPVTETDESRAETREDSSILKRLHVQSRTPPPPEEPLRQALLRQIWGRYESPQMGIRVAAFVFQIQGHLLSCIGRTAWAFLTKEQMHTGEKPRTWNWPDLETQLLAYLIAGEQAHYLPECCAAVKAHQPTPAPYTCWRLFRGEDGLLRINGRLGQSRTVPDSARHPIFLVATMPLAAEIMRLVHARTQHGGGAQFLLSETRRTYWVHRGLSLAKRVIKECARCQAHSARKIAQHTAPLHFSRENAPKGKVFFSIGIDMFGPMEVTQGRGRPRGKRYGLIFTCSFSRAINVEVMRDATADSCFMAFKRHVAIYGQPLHVNSDQGTNLLHMRKVVHEIQTAWEDAQTQAPRAFPHHSMARKPAVLTLVRRPL